MLIGKTFSVGLLVILCSLGVNTVSASEHSSSNSNGSQSSNKRDDSSHSSDSQGDSKGDDSSRGNDSQSSSKGDDSSRGNDSQSSSKGDDSSRGNDSQSSSKGEDSSHGNESLGESKGDENTYSDDSSNDGSSHDNSNNEQHKDGYDPLDPVSQILNGTTRESLETETIISALPPQQMPQTISVPEPATIALIGLGLVGLKFRRKVNR